MGFGIDKGILFTLKQVFRRPGRAAMDYIAGKRVNYYNVFYLILLLIGFNVILKYSDNYLYEWMYHEPKVLVPAEVQNITDFFNNNKKIILLSFIPIFALNSYLLFRKVGLNFAEHIILSGMAYLLIVCIFTMNNLLALLQYTIFSFVYSFYNKIALFILLFYMFYTFFQAFGDYYSRSSIILRTSIFLILVSFQILLLIIGIAMYLTAGTATIKSFQVHL